jgi:hypothetical protein
MLPNNERLRLPNEQQVVLVSHKLALERIISRYDEGGCSAVAAVKAGL